MDAYQRQAATSSCEATLVLAGPGAGKTTMLAGRVRFLLENGEQPERILCLTFSRKAAAAMRAQIATPGVVVSTFHAFCLGVLRAHPDLAGKLAQAKRLTAESTSEQASAGLDALTDAERETFTALNAAYVEKFGFPFIIAVKGLTKDQILAAFRARIGNSRDEELATACAQVERIALLRLKDMLPE